MDTALRLAEAARTETLAYFRQAELGTQNKATDDAFDPVTLADREAERVMRDVLRELRPEDAIIGEEFGYQLGTSGLTWVLDPIDGTRAYVSGLPVWGTLIAVNQGAAPIMGLIDQPYIGECFIGGFGTAVLMRRNAETPLSTRPARGLGDATLMTTFPEIGKAHEKTRFDRVRDRVKLVRYGMDCYAYAMLAMGQIDLVIEAGLQPYDIQGPQAVIEAAGGIVTDWEGGVAYNGGRVLAAANRSIHAEALSLLTAN